MIKFQNAATFSIGIILQISYGANCFYCDHCEVRTDECRIVGLTQSYKCYTSNLSSMSNQTQN